MRKAVFVGFLQIVILSVLVCSLVFGYLIGEYLESNTENDMMYSVQLIDYDIDYSKPLEEQILKLNPLTYDYTSRITIIDLDGTVLADTSNDIDYGENHLDRVEVQKAIATGKGINVRYSKTLEKSLMYVAKYSKKGNCVVRFAIPYNGVGYFAKTIVPAMVVGIIIAFLIAFVMAKRLSKTITEPLEEISGELLKIQNDGQLITGKRYKYDEINNIVRSTEILSDRIDNQMTLLREEKDKLNNILYNMREGLILVNNDGYVEIINKVARDILDCNNSEIGKNILHYTQNLKICDSVDNVLNRKEESYFDLENNGKIYVVHTTSIANGAIVLFMDVTYEREAQNIRQEFFSDASHELKTPITSINGYAELLTSGLNYSEERKTEFLNRIKTEAKNMTTLINDILMISRMESGLDYQDRNKNEGMVNMTGVIEEVVEAVEPMLSENNITVDVDIKNVNIKADYNYMYNLVNNLIVNAIKYNKKDGSVYISSKMVGDKYLFEVRDTGIGIPEEYQNRIFERFFRVDKGRNKKVGGTGLGLAIVKHVVSYYNGNIELKSKVNEGTQIIVTLNV